MKTLLWVSLAASTLVAALFVAGCKDDSSEALGPYTAQRELFFTRITQNEVPDIQWLGGRIRAAGVNRGRKAALDSTLVWITTASGDNISSYITFGRNTDAGALQSYHASPADTLNQDSLYTFWLATGTAYAAKLDSASTGVNPYTFVDTTLAAFQWVKGQNAGEGGLSNPVTRIRVLREQTATGDRFTITWTPTTSGFRNLGITMGSTGDWKNLVWLISSTSDNIFPPVVVGQVPSGKTEGTAYVDGAITAGTTYTIWMTNRNWTGSFGLTARGLAMFRFALTQ